MRWGGAVCAFLACLGVCLLVVHFRVQSMRRRAEAARVYRAALRLQAERDGFLRELLRESRRGTLERRLLETFGDRRD
jgi:hypothetical protein